MRFEPESLLQTQWLLSIDPYPLSKKKLKRKRNKFAWYGNLLKNNTTKEDPDSKLKTTIGS